MAEGDFANKTFSLDLAHAGLGFTLQGGVGSPDANGDEAVKVSDVQPSGAAYKAGVMVGDIIISVNGKTMDGLTHEQAVNLIKDAIPERVVTLDVRRDLTPSSIAILKGVSRDEATHKAFKGRDAELSRIAHELVTAPEGHKTGAGQYVKAAVFGGLDGIITTFAVVASVTGANLPVGVVIVMGFANLLADGLSMGMGEYLSAVSEQQYISSERDREEWEFDNFPEGEVNEMVELYVKQGFEEGDARNVMEIMRRNRKFFIDHMMVQELGLMPPDDDESPLKQGLVMFCAFFCFGIIPLLSYIALSSVRDDTAFLFGIACGLTACALFMLGAVKSKFSTQKWYWSGLSVLINGGIAAAAAFLVGYALDQFVDTD